MTKRKFPDTPILLDTHGSDGNPKSNLPIVLACGYRKIHIPKTGATFPVYLVRLPDQAEGVWRSKRDFLLLGRADSSLSLPKAALKKLADLSPWRRPSHDKVRDACDASDNYHVRMKKSILQLDQFLQGISKCESYDCIQAWKSFCRPGDTAGLMPEEDRESASTDLDSTDSKVTSAMKSSKLGQYFCSSENAKEVVNWIIEKCKVVLNNRSCRVIFLEPSCGKGEIVKELVHQLDSNDVPQNQVSILCFDIDNNAVNACEQTLESCRYPAKFTCQNFLETKYNASDDSPTVFCLGGPPYTTGAGSHGNIQRDLPTLFIRHCIQEYSAKALCFLLPDRYKNKLHVEGYREHIIELKSSTFFFQGTIPVTQPSIIQCYEQIAER